MTALLLSKAMTPDEVTVANFLQRKGFTLSEIAERLRVERDAVARVLYWNVVMKR